MTLNQITTSSAAATIHEVIEWAALGVELLAVAVVVTGVLLIAFRSGTIRYLVHAHTADERERYKQQLGRPLLLALELSVAADVVRIIAVEYTLGSVVVLGLLFLIRTLFSWSLFVEVEGRWPWQTGVKAAG
jgi:uncharacterized membrane protein